MQWKNSTIRRSGHHIKNISNVIPITYTHKGNEILISKKININ